jgi:hypothetical protein
MDRPQPPRKPPANTVDREHRWTWSTIAIAVLAGTSFVIAFTSRFGWPWRYDVPWLGDRWTMTPPWPSVLFLLLAFLAFWSVLGALRKPARSTPLLSALLSFFVLLIVFATLMWFMAMASMT